MAIAERLRAFLDASRVKYQSAKHPVAYTAQEIAATQHVPGRQLAKSVLVKTDRGPVLVVLPAIHLIDFKKLKSALGAKSVSIAKEADIKERFPDIEVGAMSPFGNLYQIPVVVDRALETAQEISFNAGTHTDTVTLRYQDFASLAKPKTGIFGQPISKPKKAKATSRKKPAGKPRTGTKRARRRPAAKKKRPARRSARSR